jgi:TPR repeat protein
MNRRCLWLLFALLGCDSKQQPAAAPGPLVVASGFISCADAAECEHACASGYAGACNEAGRLYEYGHAGPRDPARAFPFYERSCALGNAAGCYSAAISLELGRGAAKDPRRAASLYLEVCRMGSKTGCRRAEDLSASIKPGPRFSSGPAAP